LESPQVNVALGIEAILDKWHNVMTPAMLLQQKEKLQKELADDLSRQPLPLGQTERFFEVAIEVYKELKNQCL